LVLTREGGTYQLEVRVVCVGIPDHGSQGGTLLDGLGSRLGDLRQLPPLLLRVPLGLKQVALVRGLVVDAVLLHARCALPADGSDAQILHGDGRRIRVVRSRP